MVTSDNFHPAGSQVRECSYDLNSNRAAIIESRTSHGKRNVRRSLNWSGNVGWMGGWISATHLLADFKGAVYRGWKTEHVWVRMDDDHQATTLVGGSVKWSLR